MPEAPPKPVYVLHGRDPFLRQQRRGQIARRFTGSADPQLIVAEFDASAELAQVLDELRTVPFLARRRLVVLREADKFVREHRRQLAEYLASPSPTGSLMLIVDAWRADTKLGKRVGQLGEVIDCSAPAERQLPEWISSAARARGKRIATAAADLLAEWIGNDLARLDSEIEKLSLYVGARQTISAEDVSAVVAASAGPGPFALVNAIDAGRADRALAELAAAMTRRGEEFRVLGSIGWYLRRRSGRPRARVPGGSGKATASGAAGPGAFRRALETDLAMKTGADARTCMQLLVTGLCL